MPLCTVHTPLNARGAAKVRPQRVAAKLAAAGLVGLLALAGGMSHAAPPLPALDVQAYLGTWHQVAHYPNRFQSQCVADSSAQYSLLAPDRLQVVNRCKTTTGMEEVVGVAEPRGGAQVADGRLRPASLRVAFVPAWLRALPLVWGDYDVVNLSADGRVAIVSEPSQAYLWVLSRDKVLTATRWAEVEAWLRDARFDLARLKRDG